MPELTEKLDRFTARILAEAEAENSRAMEQARQKRQAALDKGEDQLLRESYAYIHAQVARIKGEAGRRVSRQMAASRRALCLRREEIAQETFALVRARLTAFTATPAYGARLEALLREALAALPGAGETEICLRPQDRQWIAALTRAAGGRKLVFREGDFRLGGLTALDAGRGLRVDATFDTAARELSGRFAELFGLSLAEE